MLQRADVLWYEMYTLKTKHGPYESYQPAERQGQDSSFSGHDGGVVEWLGDEDISEYCGKEGVNESEQTCQL
jgi:hypothetical protein